MYLNILKRDLKRKKTMNVILLMFTILVTMFVSSGISNVVTIIDGTDYYLDKAGIGDYVIITSNGDGGMTEILDNDEYVKEYRNEEYCMITKDDIDVEGNKPQLKNNSIILQKISSDGIRLFDKNNKIIEKVAKGQIYVTAGFLEQNGCEIGDSIHIDFYDIDRTFTIAGEIKDALLGSDMMGNTRLIISDEEFEDFKNDETIKGYMGKIFYINTDNVKELQTKVSMASHIMFDGDRNVIKKAYVMEMLVAMIVLVLSVVLCIVSFVLLKFTITFTINEEFREIGVMKAIGIKNFKIRSLYIIKYLALSIAGGLIGFVVGVPFGNVLIASVSKKMVLGNDFGILLNIAGFITVVIVTVGFAYLCTAKIKKTTPLDAIREGQTGERFSKKSKVSFTNSKLKTEITMSVGDILSSPRRFITITLIFFICSVFVFGVVMVYDTMDSDSLIESFGKRSDVYINDTKLLKIDFAAKDMNKDMADRINKVEEDVNNLGMEADVGMEMWYKYPVSAGDTTLTVTCQQNKYAKTSEYEYIEGSAPENENEIAITKQISDQLGVNIGDTVSIDFGSEKKDCMVVGYFQTMNQLGSVIRLHENAPTDMEYISAVMAYQINFKDNPDEKEIAKRIKKIKEFYDIDGIFDAKEYCNDCMGVADTMGAVSMLLLIITCIVVILVAVLMERTFISDEKDQIALLYAIGFKKGFVIRWHIVRFMIVALIAEILAVAVTYPVTKLWCDPIWNMMGAQHVEYVFNPLSLLILYPGIILFINFAAVFFTALYAGTIKSSDVRNIE